MHLLKLKILEMLENLKHWYKFKFEIIYFYNVYGPMQISKGSMATVIGIFEDQYKNNKFLTVVKPGHNQEDLLILMILLKPVIMLGKKICVDITVYQIKKVTLLNRWQNFLVLKLSFFHQEKVRDMRQH